MLDVLLGAGIYNAAIVVTRYFGGVLLGTGGLVRAYSGAVQAGLAASTVIEKHHGISLQVTTDYTCLLYTSYKRRSSKGRDRTGAEAVSGTLLQPQSSERYRKGPALSVLSYEAVQGTLPGICQPGRIPEEYQ